MNSLAVMQPYFFPYIGYFQLIKEVDIFVFYDDVDFIKNGWINRNLILINGEKKYFTIPCKDVSSFKLINKVEHGLDERSKKKLLKKIQFTYSNAPYFEKIFPLIQEILNTESDLISDIAINSITCIADFLELKCTFHKSSIKYDNQQLEATERLIDICKEENSNRYVNPIGGKELYYKDHFNKNGIELQFIKPVLLEYEQFNNKFVSGLSIIDVLMFNSPKKIVHNLLSEYRLD